MSDAVSREDVLKVLEDEGWLGDSFRRIRALPAVQPKVKPLVWVSEGPWDKAVCSYGTYYIQYDDETQAWFASLELGEVESPIILSPSDVPNWGDAEAAAHADYEARILSALEPAVQPDAMQQAMQDAITGGIGITRIAPEDFYKTAKVQPDADDSGILRATIDSLRSEVADLTRQLQGQPRRPPAHVNETPKSEHDARDVLTPDTKGGDA